MKKIELIKWSLLNSLGVLTYIFLVVLLMQHAENIFGNMNKLIGPMAFLTLFVLSATVTGALVLGRPIWLYVEGKKKEAVKLFCLTVGWMFVSMVMALTVSYFLK